MSDKYEIVAAKGGPRLNFLGGHDIQEACLMAKIMLKEVVHCGLYGGRGNGKGLNHACSMRPNTLAIIEGDHHEQGNGL